MTFVRERHLPVGISKSRIDDALGAVCEVFGERWLEGKKSHPIRRLWQSNDWLSTVELLWLGESTRKLRLVASGWLEYQIREVKREEKSVRVGAEFEILGLAALIGPDQTVTPAARAMPAYDADLNVRGNILRLSMKNFGALQRQLVFERRSADVERHVASWAQAEGDPWVGLFAMASRYPEEDDWAVLHGALPAFLTAVTPFLEVGVWHLIRHAPGPATGELEADRTSCNITILAPQHPKEHRAFLKRLQREFSAFNVAAASWPDREKAVLVRLAERAPIGEAHRAAVAFLAEDGTNIDAVILYQPSVASNREAGITMFTHHVVTAQRATMKVVPAFDFPVGPVTTDPTRDELRLNGHVITLSNYHVHQHNVIYRMAQITTNGTFEGTITSRAPGHTEHATYPTLGGNVTVSPRDKPRSEMLLFT